MGVFLWQTLFGAESHVAHGTVPTHTNSAEEAVAEYTRWLAFFTAALVFATFALFVSGERNVEVAGRSADAARESAVAAKKAVELSDRTAQLQLRAYVTLVAGKIQVVNVTQGGRAIQITIELKNSGQTPGYQFTTWIKPPQILDKDAVPFGPATPIGERTGVSIIGPGSNVAMTWILAATEDELADLLAEKKKLFVWGGADYTDIFKEKRFFTFRAANAPFTAGLDYPVAVQPHKAGYEAN